MKNDSEEEMLDHYESSSETHIPDHGNCPMTQLLDTLSGKWALPILYQLIMLNAPVRFGVLQRSVKPITQKELTRHLRQFETLGLVERKAYLEMPPRVEYQISDYGLTLKQPLSELARWSENYAQPLIAAKLAARLKKIEEEKS